MGAAGFIGAAQGYVADQRQLLQIVVDGLAVYNESIDPVIDQFTVPVYQETLRVPQGPIPFNRHGDGTSPEWQRQTYRLITAPLEDYHAGAPFTITGLQDALPSDVIATLNGLILGDVERMEQEFFRCLFHARSPGSVGTAYRASFYNGETDVPPYKQNSFVGAHSHYKGLNTTTLNLGHLDAAIADIREHGYGTRPRALVAYFSTAQEAALKALLNITVASSLTTPARVVAQDRGLRDEEEVTYAGCVIKVNDNVPAGYFGVFARDIKPIAKRQHQNPAYRGLQMLVESYNEHFPLAGRNFLNRYGFVVAHLGAGACRQLVASNDYTNPTWRLEA